MIGPCRIEIRTEQDIVLARKTGRNMARELGFNNIVQTRIATAISELARNIYLYAREGTVTIRPVDREGAIGLMIEATDRGPGIADIRKAMEDGYSTSGGLGAGLPGVKRMMDEFSIDSAPGQGTNVVAVKWMN